MNLDTEWSNLSYLARLQRIAANQAAIVERLQQQALNPDATPPARVHEAIADSVSALCDLLNAGVEVAYISEGEDGEEAEC